MNTHNARASEHAHARLQRLLHPHHHVKEEEEEDKDKGDKHLARWSRKSKQKRYVVVSLLFCRRNEQTEARVRRRVASGKSDLLGESVFARLGRLAFDLRRSHRGRFRLQQSVFVLLGGTTLFFSQSLSTVGESARVVSTPRERESGEESPGKSQAVEHQKC
jgi:hypothetical protein